MEPWTRQLLSVIVSQLCKTIGWHSISTSCLQVLVDVLHRYLKQLGTTVHDYSEHYNHTLPALEELSLALNDMGINVDDLKEYVDYVAPINIKEKVPKYPLEKKSNLNFLKPGSREVVTRPVHIHEHLPAMHPELAEEYGLSTPGHDRLGLENGSSSLPNLQAMAAGTSAASAYQMAGDGEKPLANKHIQRLISDEIGRPLRELSSVTMAPSGFLVPGKEGKAPEARVPKPLINYSTPVSTSSGVGNSAAASQPSTHAAAPLEVKPEKSEHKKHSHSKSSKSGDRKIRDEVHHNGHDVADEIKVKKHFVPKEVPKMKPPKTPHKFKENHEFVPRPPKPEKVKVAPPPPVSPEPKVTLPKPPEKVEKPPPAIVEPPEPVVEKLPTEPNKSKLNIFKRFTKPKEERSVSPVPPRNNHFDKNAQINECIEAVVKRSREKEDPNAVRVREKPEPPPAPVIAESKLEPEPVPSVVLPGKHLKRKKKPKNRDLGPNNKRMKLSREPLMPSMSPPKPQASVEKAPKPAAEPEPPPYSFFTQLQNTPGLMPPSLSSNLLIPRFAPFMHFPKMADPNGPHPEMPNLPLPPPTLMQPPPPEPNHKIAAAAPPVSKKAASDEKKVENNEAPVLSDKKLKKKLKKDKKEKEKKKREKKERLKKERLEKKDLKKQSKMEKLKKKKLAAEAAVTKKEEPKPAVEDATAVPKIKLKLNSGASPQLSPSAGASGIQSPKIVIKPVLKPADETLNAAASSGSAAAAPPHPREERESSPELAKIAYIGKTPKQKSASSKAAAADNSVVVTSAPAPTNNHVKPEPIAPITLLKSGNEKNVKIKPKPKEKPAKSKKTKTAAAAKPKPAGFYYDADGQQIWVCPACGKQDDGTPMIGCDGGCDAWYHWECVGIKSPPSATNWYCKSCVNS